MSQQYQFNGQPYGYPTLPRAQAPIPVGMVSNTQPSGPSAVKVLAWVGFGGFAALSISAILLLVMVSVGPAAIVFGAALAVLPVAPVGFFYLWLDRFEPEPPSLLAFAFIWGAAVATLAALILNETAMSVITGQSGIDVAEYATTVRVAPVVEEAAKGLAPLLVFLMRRRDFDGIVDGIVYAGMVGLGFAFTENILYLSTAYFEGGAAQMWQVFILRGVFSPFAHPMFTAATGIAFGIAATRRSLWVKIFAPIGGYIVAVALHMLWNGSATLGGAFILLYFLVQVPLFVGYILVAVLARRREGRIITAHALAYAQAGWISYADATMLGSFRTRAQARAWAGRVGGPRAAKAMRNFQSLAGELMFQRDRMVRGTAGKDAARHEYAGLLGLAQLRATFPQP